MSSHYLPNKHELMKTFDVHNKSHQTKQIPKPNSRQESTKHKRQTTMFKFHHDDSSKDKLLLKTNSSLSISFNSIGKENINQTNLSNKVTLEGTNLSSKDVNNHISQIDFQKAKQKYSCQNIKKILKINKIGSGKVGSISNTSNLVIKPNENVFLQSTLSSKQQSVKKKCIHSRSISKNSGRGSRSSNNPKKQRKNKNQTLDFNSLIYNTHSTINSQNRNQGCMLSKIPSNNSSKYHNLIGACNPGILFQTIQCCETNNAKNNMNISPKESSKPQICIKNKQIRRKQADQSLGLKLNSRNCGVNIKKSDKRRKNTSKNSNSRSKNTSIKRSSNKQSSHKSTSSNSKIKFSKEKGDCKVLGLTQTARDNTGASKKENLNWKQNMKACLSSSKITSWIEALNNYSCSDIGMNKVEETNHNEVNIKRNKSSRSNGSNMRKKDKYYTSIAKTIDKRMNCGNLIKNDLNNQFIEIVKNLHSPPNQNLKSHNHSHSEVYSQKAKKDKLTSKKFRTKDNK